jgi:heme exporter protein C
VVLGVFGVWITAGIILSFAVKMPPGNFADLEAYRAVFFHMPLALVGCLAFMVAAVHAARYLASGKLSCDAAAWGAAEAGLVLTFLATVTGMVFAKNQWGTWWNWDPRQTSIFFVLLMYAAYLALRQALPEDEALRARLGAAYLLIAVAPMMYLVMVYPRHAPASLHPAKAPFEAIHWRVMLANFVGFLGLFAWISWFQAGVARLRAAARGRW